MQPGDNDRFDRLEVGGGVAGEFGLDWSATAAGAFEADQANLGVRMAKDGVEFCRTRDVAFSEDVERLSGPPLERDGPLTVSLDRRERILHGVAPGEVDVAGQRGIS